MALETATYISDLTITNPTSTDAKSVGDDHIRLLKSTLKTTFPAITGAVLPTHTELNFVDGVTSAIQVQIDTKSPSASPTFTGTVVLPAATSIGTVSAAEIAYVDGVTSAIQTQLDAKQPLDSDLTAVAGLATTGIIARTGTGTAATRTLTAPAAGITITNGDGVAGNPTLVLANDLAALEGLTTTGIIIRTGDGTAIARTLTGPAAGITVTNGDGIAGNPTIALANDLAALEGLAANGMIARTSDGAATVRTITAGTGVTITNGDGVSGNPTITVNTGIGLGDVVGPAASIDNEIALFDSTTGKLIKRATTTGLLKATSGVISAVVSGTDIKTINSASILGSGDIATVTPGKSIAFALIFGF